MNYALLAEEVLQGRVVSPDEARGILRSSEDELLGLLHGAFLLRKHYFGRGVWLHVLRNAKSGGCTEDCGYCSQSAAAKGTVGTYPLQTVDELVQGAREAARARAVRYCIVTAGREVSEEELNRICDAVCAIKQELPLSICVSLGVLDDERAERLKRAGVDRYNHNLETSERHFPSLCSTHTYADRWATARRAKDAGMQLCSGALLGVGESLEDRVDVAMALRELGVDALPVNCLDPRPVTPLGRLARISPLDALRALAMFRFVLPAVELRVAGGREQVFGTMQALTLYPANSLFTLGYLTTPGQGLDADMKLIETAGFHVAGCAL